MGPRLELGLGLVILSISVNYYNLYWSDGAVKASALQVEEDNIWSVGSLFAVVCHYF